MKVRNCKTTCR